MTKHQYVFPFFPKITKIQTEKELFLAFVGQKGQVNRGTRRRSLVTNGHQTWSLFKEEVEQNEPKETIV
jgi:hypothetical protein